MPVLLLTTTGQRTGRRRTATLTYFRDGGDLIVIGSFGGSDLPPAWWLNLQADPRASVLIGGTIFKVTARAATIEERNRLWPLATRANPGYARYQERTARPIPVVLLMPESVGATLDARPLVGVERGVASHETASWQRRGLTPAKRFFVYGLTGWAVDSLFVWVNTGRRRPSGLSNIAVYGLAQPLFEPVHDRLRHRARALRASVYGVGILGVEYASGRLLRRLLGQAPWDYGEARLGIGGGLVRLDYLPLWGIFGLGLERLHDVLRPAPSERARSRRSLDPEARLTPR